MHVMSWMSSYVILSCWVHPLWTGSGWEYLFLMVRNIAGYCLGMTLTPAAFLAWNHVWRTQATTSKSYIDWLAICDHSCQLSQHTRQKSLWSTDPLCLHQAKVNDWKLYESQPDWMNGWVKPSVRNLLDNYDIRPVLQAEVPKRESYLNLSKLPWNFFLLVEIFSRMAN